MAADASHLLFVEQLPDDPRLQADLRTLLRAHWRWVRVGAVLVDLPYFDGFVRRALDDLRGLPDRTSFWGDRFHRDGAEHLVGAILRRALRLPDPEPLVALAIGLHSHVLLDVATHPDINRAAAEIVARDGGRPEAAHRAVENVQAELWHRSLRGHRLFGDPRAFGLLAVRAEGLAHGRIGANLADAITEVFGWNPGRLDWHRWNWGMLEYAFAAAGPMGRIHVPERLVRAHRGWFDGTRVDFPAVVRACLDTLAVDAAEIYAHFRTGRLAPGAFHLRFPERNLDYPDRPVGQPVAL